MCQFPIIGRVDGFILFVDLTIISNDFTRFDENNENAAEVGVDETTEKLASYFHPKNKKITFWDLPGFGMYIININLTKTWWE